MLENTGVCQIFLISSPSPISCWVSLQMSVASAPQECNSLWFHRPPFLMFPPPPGVVTPPFTSHPLSTSGQSSFYSVPPQGQASSSLDGAAVAVPVSSSVPLLLKQEEKDSQPLGLALDAHAVAGSSQEEIGAREGGAFARVEKDQREKVLEAALVDRKMRAAAVQDTAGVGFRPIVPLTATAFLPASAAASAAGVLPADKEIMAVAGEMMVTSPRDKAGTLFDLTAAAAAVAALPVPVASMVSSSSSEGKEAAEHPGMLGERLGSTNDEREIGGSQVLAQTAGGNPERLLHDVKQEEAQSAGSGFEQAGEGGVAGSCSSSRGEEAVFLAVPAAVRRKRSVIVSQHVHKQGKKRNKPVCSVDGAACE